MSIERFSRLGDQAKLGKLSNKHRLQVSRLQLTLKADKKTALADFPADKKAPWPI